MGENANTNITITTTGEWVSPPAFRKEWDVFLNFRGEDTRKEFTRPLHAALTSKGVRAFIDDEGLTQGDELERKLPDSILDCAAAITIISPSYASSRWCLEELAKIQECGRLILPVFYHVNPSDVRRQREPFEKDFEKLERSGENATNVARWREAMKKTGGQSGWVVANPQSSENGDDTHLIGLLVERILSELKKTPMDVATYIVGHKDSMEELIRLLELTSSGIRVLGIWGMGGIGKTTLVKTLYNKKLVSQFKRRSFISDVGGTYEKQPNGLDSLRVKLHTDLSLGNEAHGTRALLVLDDVNDASRLRELATWWRNWFDEGSRIIITTRNKELLADCHVDIVYEMKELCPSDSLDLFVHHALKSKKPTERRLKLSCDIVSLTGGLPLALEVFGSFLFDKRRDVEWEDAIKKLEKNSPGHLLDVLKISFDGLDEKEKCIFLDISCLFVNLDMKLENLIDILQGCGFKAELSINVLISRSLIKIKENSYLWMHDQIRDMGRQIVQLENADFGKRSRLWDRGEISNLLENDKGTKRIQGIIVDLENKISPMDRTAKFISWGMFPGMPCITSAIRYMIETLKKYFHHGSIFEEDVILETKLFQSMARLRLLHLCDVRLKGSFKIIFRELKWLQWKRCPLDSLPSSCFPELTVIDVSESNIKNVWDEKKWWCWWYSAKVAENLMVMNLHGCYNLTSIPDLSRHPGLEKLILERCVSLVKIHKSLGELKKLRHLNLKDCSSLVEFPNCVSGLKSLETLTLSGCSKLTTLPSKLQKLVSLRELFLDNTAIQELPKSILWLIKLEVLSINNCQSLRELPHDIGNLVALKTLSANNSVLEGLPDTICMLENLEILSLLWCQSLSALPISVGNLRSLVSFSYSGGSVQNLPDSIGSLSFLKELSVINCPNIKELPASISGLASAVELTLEGLSVTYLPDFFEGLKSLQKLVIRNCKELKSLPESIKYALTLTTIIIESSAIIKLPESIGMLEDLSLLRLNKCTQLSELPYSFGNLKSLHHLYMQDTAITKLPENFGLLSKLITLIMPKNRYDGNLTPTVLPDSFSGLSSLQELDAHSWKLIGKIPDDFEKLTSLETLNLGRNDFHTLPSNLRELSVLRKLFIQHCENLKSLPPLPSSLVELNAANCISMETISDLSNLSNLRDLNLANCWKLTHIPGLECLSSLRRLHMTDCTSCYTMAKDKLKKLAVRKLYSVSWPGDEIPDWFTEEEISFSNPSNFAVKAVIISVIISVNHVQIPDHLKGHIPGIPGVLFKIMRSNIPIFTTSPLLEGVPNSGEDHFFLCRYENHHPLVSILRDGDRIKVAMQDPPLVEGFRLQRSGIYLVFENEDDYVGDEHIFPEDERTASHRLTTFIGESSNTLYSET